MAKPQIPAPLNIEDFNYLPDSKFPALVLGIHIPYDHFRSDSCAPNYRCKPGREWLKIVHQTGGVACSQHYWIGTIIKPTSLVQEGMRLLAKKWYGSEVGVGIVPLDEIIAYRADLKRCLNGVDCNNSYSLFEEGHFPIDTEWINDLTDEAFPNDLDDLLEWENGFQRCAGCIGRWGLVVLGVNSD